MRKLLTLAIALLVIGVIGASTMAQQPTLISAAHANVRTRGAFGSGLAISQTDPMDFELIKVAVAGVAVSLADEAKVVKVGVLHFGEDKYRLRDVEIGNGTASANIYDTEGTQVGSVSLDSYPKGDTEIWTGELSLNDEKYNAYVIQVKRLVKAVEKARRVFSYCENHPAQCLRVMRGIGNIICDPEAEGTTCRERIKTYCENNPEDRRCIALRLAYCRIHLDDADCRGELMEKCKENVNDEACEKLGMVYGKIVEKKPQVVKNAPQWFVTVRNRIKSKLTAGESGG